ncbi:MAG: methylenetetrahydrofolate reductase [NAD(P)H] [Candidatus Omnitrophica bacterium]|nr:methylenetetrahydrofolate reductase [NAD(P)H] [Candidatus Omnitrophota bacterium]
MRLDRLYQGGAPDISIELFPPKTPEGVEGLFQTVEQLKRLKPAFFSMTYGAAGSTRDATLALCDRLKNQAGVETTCHLTVVGQSKAEVRENLAQLKRRGIYNVLALRGDPPAGDPTFKPHPDGFQTSVELIREARRDPWFAVAVSGFPEVHQEARDRAADIAYLKDKIAAGACVILTQLFFDNAYFLEFLDHVRRAGITAPVVPGILPILSVTQVRRFAALCGATIPPAVARELANYEQDDAGAARYGIELATRQCEGLLAAGVPGLHFYALNRPRSVEAVVQNLGLDKGRP